MVAPAPEHVSPSPYLQQHDTVNGEMKTDNARAILRHVEQIAAGA
jgi:hypothetical protein